MRNQFGVFFGLSYNSNIMMDNPMFFLPNGMSRGIIYQPMILVVSDPPQIAPDGKLVAVYVVGKEGKCGSRVTIRLNLLAFLHQIYDVFFSILNSNMYIPLLAVCLSHTQIF